MPVPARLVRPHPVAPGLHDLDGQSVPKSAPEDSRLPTIDDTLRFSGTTPRCITAGESAIGGKSFLSW